MKIERLPKRLGRWLAVLLILLLLLIVWLWRERPLPPAPTPLPTPVGETARWQLYLPRVVAGPPTAWLRRGVAWYAPGTYKEADLLQAWWVYHSAGCHRARGRVLPIVRPVSWVECAGALPREYAGWLLVGNEGEFPGQDNLTPAAMAQFVAQVRQRWPRARLVCLNSYLIGYMEQVMAAMERPCEVWGLHVYQQPEWLPSQRVDAVCDAVERRWEGEECRVIITEMGHSVTLPKAYQVMRTWTADALADPRVLVVMVYTAREAVPERLNVLESDGQLRATGRGWVDGGG